MRPLVSEGVSGDVWEGEALREMDPQFGKPASGARERPFLTHPSMMASAFLESSGSLWGKQVLLQVSKGEIAIFQIMWFCWLSDFLFEGLKALIKSAVAFP